MRYATAKAPDTLDYSSTEALNSICSNLAFTGKNMRKLVFTSSTSGEGKSLLTFQVACNLAKRGKRVVLIDADLRRSTMAKKMNLETTGELTGLVHYLTNQNSLDDILYSTSISNIYIIPAGRCLKNPVHLLDSDDFRELLSRLAASFDMVLVDAPPVGLVIDAAEIAKACDGTILVARYNEARRRDLIEVKRQMLQTGCPILGCIINMATFDGLVEKKYYNRGYYSHYNDLNKTAKSKHNPSPHLKKPAAK